MKIQDHLRQWSSSTLDKYHREVGEEAADRIDELEAAILHARTSIEENGYSTDVWFGLSLVDIEE